MNLRDVKARAVVRARLNRIQLGNFGDCKSDGEQIVVLLCGGDKRSQSKDISQAKTFWKEYKNADKKLPR